MMCFLVLMTRHVQQEQSIDINLHVSCTCVLLLCCHRNSVGCDPHHGVTFTSLSFMISFFFLYCRRKRLGQRLLSSWESNPTSAPRATASLSLLPFRTSSPACELWFRLFRFQQSNLHKQTPIVIITTRRVFATALMCIGT